MDARTALYMSLTEDGPIDRFVNIFKKKKVEPEEKKKNTKNDPLIKRAVSTNFEDLTKEEENLLKDFDVLIAIYEKKIITEASKKKVLKWDKDLARLKSHNKVVKACGTKILTRNILTNENFDEERYYYETFMARLDKLLGLSPSA